VRNRLRALSTNSNRGSRCPAGALKTLNIARARAGAARAGWWQSRDPRQRGLIRFVVPAGGFAGEPEKRFAAPALYEKLYCPRGEMENPIKEAQQDLFADRTARAGWPPINCGSGSQPSPISCSRCCGLRFCWHRSCHGHPRPDSTQALQDWCLSQDQSPTHPPGVSQRLPPIRKFSDVPVPTSAQCRRAEFKKPFVDWKKRANSRSWWTLLPSFGQQNQPIRSASTPRRDKPRKSWQR
jgi:hypothetical protein